MSHIARIIGGQTAGDIYILGQEHVGDLMPNNVQNAMTVTPNNGQNNQGDFRGTPYCIKGEQGTAFFETENGVINNFGGYWEIDNTDFQRMVKGANYVGFNYQKNASDSMISDPKEFSVASGIVIQLVNTFKRKLPYHKKFAIFAPFMFSKEDYEQMLCDKLVGNRFQPALTVPIDDEFSKFRYLEKAIDFHAMNPDRAPKAFAASPEQLNSGMFSPLITAAVYQRRLFEEIGKRGYLNGAGTVALTDFSPVSVDDYHRSVCDNLGNRVMDPDIQRLKELLGVQKERLFAQCPTYTVNNISGGNPGEKMSAFCSI
jgi:hypothetical protein